MSCISALCGEGKVFQMGKLGEDELSGPICGSYLELSVTRPRTIIRESLRTRWTILVIWGNEDATS